jgi:hypothetical protein
LDPAHDEAEAAGATSLRPCLSAKPWQVDGARIGESSPKPGQLIAAKLSTRIKSYLLVSRELLTSTGRPG